MGLSATILFYLLFGAGVAAAVAVTTDGPRRGERLQTAAAALFWPLFVPVLLHGGSRRTPPPGAAASGVPADPLDAAITQAETEVAVAFASLDGWAEGVLAHEQGRFDELRAAWRAQADRIRQLDALLSRTEPSDEPTGDAGIAGATGNAAERIQTSVLARRENIRKLQAVRQKLHSDLQGTLAWVRELATMIHLAKHTGAPASRAQELATQIAAAVEGLTEVSGWKSG